MTLWVNHSEMGASLLRLTVYRSDMNRLPLTAALVLVALLSGCSSASSIVTGQRRPPYDEDKVVVYLAPPSVKYEVIGLVTAKTSKGWTQQGYMDSAVANMKEEAADLGANGIILTGTGSVASGGMAMGTSPNTAVMATVNTPTVTGTAIWVEPAQDTPRATPQTPPVVTAETKSQESGDKKTDLYTEIMKLDELRKKGLLTDAEFEKQKQKLLGN